jgi:1,4-alpha-glucan branching enzyme
MLYMLRKQATFNEEKVKLTFELPARDGEQAVRVAGEFNNWDPSTTTLHREGKFWQASIVLPTGKQYAFRYYRDGGDWFNDEQADGYQPNPYGTVDSLIDLTPAGW